MPREFRKFVRSAFLRGPECAHRALPLVGEDQVARIRRVNVVPVPVNRRRALGGLVERLLKMHERSAVFCSGYYFPASSRFTFTSYTTQSADRVPMARVPGGAIHFSCSLRSAVGPVHS